MKKLQTTALPRRIGCSAMMREKSVSRNEHVRNLCEVAVFILKNMPCNAATKFAIREVLREAVNLSCPDSKSRDKTRNAKYISIEAEKALREKSCIALHVDHAVPIGELLALIFTGQEARTVEGLLELVPKFSVMTLITKIEHEALTKAGLKKQMPVEWNRQDALARYNHLNIQLKEIKEIHDYQALIAR